MSEKLTPTEKIQVLEWGGTMPHPPMCLVPNPGKDGRAAYYGGLREVACQYKGESANVWLLAYRAARDSYEKLQIQIDRKPTIESLLRVSPLTTKALQQRLGLTDKACVRHRMREYLEDGRVVVKEAPPTGRRAPAKVYHWAGEA